MKQPNGARRIPPDCHPDRPQYALKMCLPCYERDLKLRNPEWADRLRASARKRGHESLARRRELRKRPDNAAKIRERNKANRQKNRPRVRRRLFTHRLRTVYGMTRAEFDIMLIEHCGRCGICGEPTPNLHLDHNHDTRTARGLLCNTCNVAIGLFRDRIDLLMSAACYLAPHDWLAGLLADFGETADHYGIVRGYFELIVPRIFGLDKDDTGTARMTRCAVGSGGKDGA